MLNENIKNLRKAKGLSQEELAIKLHVVRQTLSKWENGLSVPDSVMLISLADALDVSVNELLSETALQLAKRSMARIKTIRWLLISLCLFIVAIFIILININGSYLNWNYNDPELAVAGTIIHAFEFLFVRIAPIVFLASIIGIVLTYRKR